MKMRVLAAIAVAVPLAFGTSRLMAQGNSDVHVPDSSIEKPGEQGHKAHTNHVIALRGNEKPDRGHGNPPPPPPPAGPAGKSPDQIRAAYGLPASGGGDIIAIVDAFHYPTALSDFNTFAGQFQLPQEPSGDPLNPSNNVFQVVYATGTVPATDCGWAQEEALDIEWAHAMAPGAKIVLVEAASNSFSDLLDAVNVAAGTVGAKQISMSWGGSEFFGEMNFDSAFNNQGVTYFAASGDTGGKTIYPGVSQFVVAAGGTSLKQDSHGNWVETGWSGSGGGPSQYVNRPGFQSSLPSQIGLVKLNGKRAVPDFSFDADPNTGVAVYDSTSCQGLVGWMVFGGTSVSSPSLAGIVNLANHQKGLGELDFLYMGYGNSGFYNNFRDVTSGSAGKYTATTQYDLVTGIGSSIGTDGK